MADAKPAEKTETKAALTEESSTRLADWSKRWRELKRDKNYIAWRRGERARADKTTQSRRDLMEALTKFVEAAGGTITSVPGSKNITAQIPPGSSLPTKLTELGWHISQLGATVRVTNAGLQPVDVIEISK